MTASAARPTPTSGRPVRRFTAGHSPDADDAFMFYALTSGRAPIQGPAPARVEAAHADIQTLNERAAHGAYDMSQISAAAYPSVAKHYQITACGSSMGEGYGPVVVAPRPLAAAALAGRRVAVPGRQTTAFLLAQIYLPQFQPVQLPFDQAFEAVRGGRADAAVVIHEGQLTYQAAGFAKVLDLGAAWFADTGLPLPLGINVVRRALSEPWRRALTAALAASIEFARGHRAEALAHARALSGDLDADVSDRFTAMYVTDLTRDMGGRGRAALAELYTRAPGNSGNVPLDVAPAP